MLQEEELENSILAILANKQDDPDALTVPEVYDVLELDDLRPRIFQIFATSASRGEGVIEAVEWLRAELAIRD